MYISNGLTEEIRNSPVVERRDPNLFRRQFPFSRVPSIHFDGKVVPPSLPDEIWITDTTFRDGQQARLPYTAKQVIDIYTLLQRLGGPKGVIRQCEFFVYSRLDKEAVEGCVGKGFPYPQVTSWIRANNADLQIVKELNIKETGILTSVSDYHIYLKLKKTRREALEDYLAIVRSALESGIIPRCHFEDVTRADIYGFCLPFAGQLLRLSEDSKIPIKIRLCDTLGYGISYPGTALPRSIPKLAHAFHAELGYPSGLLEWHGHNDFHKVHINAATAWLYGVSALNASVLGYGERTGNPPLEGAVIEYIGIRGATDGMDTTVITELADYYRNEVKADIPANYPFVGSEFNVTRAGIHADGLMKNQEIYNVFDTEKILNRPVKVLVTDKSGMAGIARWLNENIPLIVQGKVEPVKKRHSGIRHISEWVQEQYAQGRKTAISTEELMAQAKHYLPSAFESDFEGVKEEARRKAQGLAQSVSAASEIQTLSKAEMEPYLKRVVKKEASIQLLAITDTEGQRISQVHTQRGEKGLFRNLLNKNFRQKEWFVQVLETGEPYFSDLFFSKYTGALIFTAALPVYNDKKRIYAVIDIDFKFNELVKLVG
jgi:isopropylmalate/homocitrate/citramalate synthase